ncbi:cell cycle checkpoint control protein rad9a [Rhizophlyctis rosea]|nr:cell cycle checkpoint control protein rad9a [Rhizophlyctis rosea]
MPSRDQQQLCGQVQLKPVLNIFKARTNLDNVESCQIKFDPTSDEDRFTIQLHCKYGWLFLNCLQRARPTLTSPSFLTLPSKPTSGVLKTHKLYYEPVENLNFTYAKHTCKHRWTVNNKIIHDWLSHFQAKLEEVVMSCKEDSMTLRSFTEGWGGTDKNAPGQRSMQTSLQVDIADFDLYEVSEDVSVTFSLKELKVVLSLAESMNQTVTAYFDTPGSPIVFTVAQKLPELYIGDFVVATNNDAGLGDEESEYSSQAVSSQVPSSARRGDGERAVPMDIEVGREGGVAVGFGMEDDEEIPPSPPYFSEGMQVFGDGGHGAGEEGGRDWEGNREQGDLFGGDGARQEEQRRLNKELENDLFSPGYDEDDGMDTVFAQVDPPTIPAQVAPAPSSPQFLVPQPLRIPTMNPTAGEPSRPPPAASVTTPVSGAGVVRGLTVPTVVEATTPVGTIGGMGPGGGAGEASKPISGLRRPREIVDEDAEGWFDGGGGGEMEVEILEPTPPVRKTRRLFR